MQSPFQCQEKKRGESVKGWNHTDTFRNVYLRHVKREFLSIRYLGRETARERRGRERGKRERERARERKEGAREREEERERGGGGGGRGRERENMAVCVCRRDIPHQTCAASSPSLKHGPVAFPSQ